jgi:hypothetical protein
LIFFGVPHLFNQWRGETQSREEREIRDEVSFQASQESTKKRKSSDEPESLPSRIYRTLDGVPRNGQWEGERQKSPIDFVLLCFKLFTITINAKKPLLSN